jgi:lantibiotic leader peptide-processing serine protease
MTKRLVVLTVALMAAVSMLGAAPGDAQPSSGTSKATYLVLYREGASLEAAHAAIKEAGGTITRENTKVGLATVSTRNANFRQDVKKSGAIEGVSRNRSIGYAPKFRPKTDGVENDRTASSGRSSRGGGGGPDAEPLAGLLWGHQMIDATLTESYSVQPGRRGVIVAVIDTGVDGSHPDIAPNFNESLSRNWTVDIPDVDGPCEDEADASCNDPQDVDENSHGTHVAGTIAAAFNGLGMAGVAPNVTIVNDRAGQDSGYFFLQETVNALTYAGDIGADVANMSFFTDPWWMNCPDNPADSPEAQEEQRTTIIAINRATIYAHNKGVTLIAAEGNDDTDLGNPTEDTISPDYPPGSEYPREVDNGCFVLPTEARHVLSVSALGPTTRKAYYSNYGLEQTFVSAPGGDRREYFGTPQYNAVDNRILSTYPESLAIEFGDLNPDGTPNTPFVVRECEDGVCGYYQYLQGTSMASPHAAGVAALIVSQFGQADPAHPGGLTLNPDAVKNRLKNSATDHACPTPRLFTYPDLDESFDAFCAGTPEFNGFYGHGIVDALAAVSGP